MFVINLIPDIFLCYGYWLSELVSQLLIEQKADEESLRQGMENDAPFKEGFSFQEKRNCAFLNYFHGLIIRTPSQQKLRMIAWSVIFNLQIVKQKN